MVKSPSECMLYTLHRDVDSDLVVCRSVVFYNSLARSRTSIARVHVNVANVEVQDADGRVIASQLDPFFADNEVSSATFKVCQHIVPHNIITTYHSHLCFL